MFQVGNATLNRNSSTNGSVVFLKAFRTVPVVNTWVQRVTGDNLISVYPANVTTTGFDYELDHVPDDTDDYSLGWMAGDASIDTPAHPSVSYGGGAAPATTPPPPARPAGFRGLPSMPFSGRLGPAYGVFPADAGGKEEQIESDPDGSAEVVLYFAPNSAMLENIHVLVVNISDVVIYETTDRTDVMITSRGNVDVHTLHVPVGTLPRQPAIWQIKVGNGPIRRFISGRNMR